MAIIIVLCAPLLAFKHTTISEHIMEQVYVVKTRKNIILHLH
jgi:hypothetical protein